MLRKSLDEALGGRLTRLHTLGLVFIVAFGVLAAPSFKAKSVEVTNFPGVQTVDGTVSVDNFPASHTVDGTVAVSNLPVDADGNLRVGGEVSVAAEGLRQIWGNSIQLRFADGDKHESGTIEVPAGKRLVIEMIGGRGLTEVDQALDVDLFIGNTPGRLNLFRWSTASYRWGTWDRHLLPFQLTRIVIDDDSTKLFNISAERSSGTGTANLIVDFRGYLVDLP